MKKRLSLLLAALMIITMLPMSAFAAARPLVTVQTFQDTKGVKDVRVTLKFAKDQEVKPGHLRFVLENAKLAPVLSGTAADVPGQRPVDGKFLAPVVITSNEDVNLAGNVADAVVDVIGDADHQYLDSGNRKALSDSDTEFTFDVKAGKGKVEGKEIELSFDLFLNVDESQDGEVKLKVEDLGTFLNGTRTPVGVGDIAAFTIAKVDRTTRSLSVTAKDPSVEISYDGGEVSRFEIRNFYNVAADPQPTHLVIELDEDDYYAFDKKDTKVYVDGVAFNNFTWDNRSTTGDGYRIVIKATDLANKQVISVIPTIQRMGRAAGEGSLDIQVMNVKANGFAPGTTDPMDNIKTDGNPARTNRDRTKVLESASATIGKVIDYKVTMTVKEKNKSEIPSLWGGETAVVTVTLKGPKGSFADRGIEFEVDGAGVVEVYKRSVRTKPVLSDTVDVSDGLIQEGIYKDGKFTIVLGRDLDKKLTELTFDMKIVTDHDKNGTATIKAAQRGWEAVADLAKVTPKFTVETKATEVMKSQVNKVENIVITEAKQGLLRKGEKITLLFETTRDYIEFEKIAKAEATNGMELGSVKILTADKAWSGNSSLKGFSSEHNKFNKASYKSGKAYIAAEVEIKKPSKDGAAVITFSGVDVRVDGSTVDGVYKVKAGLNGFTVAAADYVTTVKEYGLKPTSTVFTIGQTQYTVNGEAKTAASAPYVKNGRTMLPVRALAESLGLRVQWNSGTKTATFTDESKVAAVVIGADVIHVNGTPIKLNAKAEVVNGTTFIELRSLATAFGVQIDWDAAAKQATVSK